MNKGEKITLVGVAGMILMAMCLDSDFWIPALILFAGFALMAFAGHWLADEGFIDSDDLKKIDQKKVERNRDEVFATWLETGFTEYSLRMKKPPQRRGKFAAGTSGRR